MARLFTLPFQFKEQQYTAFVSITKCTESSIVAIRLPDESLHPVLGADTLSFDQDLNEQISAVTPTSSDDLVSCILQAYAQYVQNHGLQSVKTAYNTTQVLR